MTIYFDTNIYDWIASKDEAKKIREFLNSQKLRLYISKENLLEIVANNNKPERRKEIENVIELRPRHEKLPQSYLHSLELHNEIKRVKRNWLKLIPHKKSLNKFLDMHSLLWENLKKGDIPKDSISYEYRRDVEEGVNKSKEYQKSFKEIQNKAKKNLREVKIGKGLGKEIDANPLNPEEYWRLDAMSVWRSAILEKNPASRDYYDWLSPYITEGAFRDQDYENFWLHLAEGDNMPLNRFLGLISYFQSQHKITHGNPFDQIHAGNYMLYDLFFTADKTFFQVLSQANEFLTEPKFPPILLDRREESVYDELSRRIKEFEKLM